MRFTGVSTLELIIPCALIIIIWTPQGFRLEGLIEEWDIVGLFATYGVFFVISPSGEMLQEHRLRPLEILTHAVAFSLDNASFIGWHLLQISITIGLYGAIYQIYGLYSKQKIYQHLAAIITVTYPADTMRFAFRGLHINLAITLITISIVLLAIKHHGIAGRARTILAVLLISISIFIYESTIFVYLALTIWIVGATCSKIDLYSQIRRLISPALVSVIMYSFYYLYAINSNISTLYGYNQFNTEKYFDTVLFLKHEIYALFHVVVNAIIQSAHVFFTENNKIYAIVSAVIIITMVEYLGRRSSGLNARSWKKASIASLVGAAIAFLPYGAEPAHAAVSQRTFLMASLPVCLGIVNVLEYISTGAKKVRLIIALVVVTLNINFVVYESTFYTNISLQQKDIIEYISGALRSEPRRGHIVVWDETNSLGQTWMLPPGTLALALAFSMKEPVRHLEICHSDFAEWQHYDASGRKGVCQSDGSHMVLSDSRGLGLSPRDKMEGVVLLPLSDVNMVTVPAKLWMLDNTSSDSNVVVGQKLYSLHSQGRVDLGTVWSMTRPFRGSGWGEPGWIWTGLRYRPFAPLVSRCGSLYPDSLGGMPRQWRLRVAWSVPPLGVARDTIRVIVNRDEPVLHVWSGAVLESLGSGVINVVNICQNDNYKNQLSAIEWVKLEKN